MSKILHVFIPTLNLRHPCWVKVFEGLFIYLFSMIICVEIGSYSKDVSQIKYHFI